ncbi:uncharacterized protein LOC123511872 isoform X2 [Portunus trituberculatus]|nr:uncharacterized protein LOC123511872 isoform X2 [Portunus trituberculatus]
MYVTRLLDLNVLHTRDETTLTKFQLLKSRECFRQNIPSNLPHSKLGVVEGLFAMCMTLYHSYELMLQHGTRSFYRFLKEALNGEKGNYFLRGELRNNNLFQSIMNDLSKKFEGDCVMSPSKQNQSGLFSVIGSPQPTSGAGTSKAPFVISHPKMAKLQEIVLEHHQKFANEGKSTRIIIFSQYRESVMEITEMLQQHHPTVKAMSFIGHGTNSQSRKGLSQKKQLEVVSKFRGGDYNTLVSTCVGEEGLDIGDVDLIVCYDAPKSPIRLVQRMGRTGRQREGRIVVLVTVGKEEQNYNASQHQKKTINNALANTSKLARYLTPSSPRMVPSGLSPSCLKLHMKVDAWKTNIKAGKGTPRGRGSILSMMSRTSAATSKAGQRASWMSQEEWQWCRNNKVPQEDIRTLPPPSLMCLDASKYTFDRKRHINLGSYQPWQTLPQKTHLVGHSPLTRHLVEVTEFIGLQQLVGADEDPYGLEMAAFLDKAYVEDDEDIYHLSPDFKKSNNRQDQEDKIENKRKRKQNALTNKRKKPKVVQSSLITDMFSKMTQSQAKNREDNHSKEEATTRRVVGPGQASVKTSGGTASVVQVRDNDGDDDDDDVICLMDDNDDFQSTPKSVAVSQSDRHKSLAKMEPSRNNILNKNHTRKIEDETPGDTKGQLLLPVPSGSVVSIGLLSPPQSSDDEEIEEPDSPSEPLEFCSKWVTRNQKKMSPLKQKINALSCSKVVSVAQTVGASKHANNAASRLIDDNDDNEQQLDSSLFRIVETSPVIGKSQCTKNKVMTNISDSGNQSLITPGDAANLMELDTSPIVGRGGTQHSASTPKLVSKRLFKKFTPGLSAVGEFSPIPWKDSSASPSGVGHSSMRGGKGQQDTPQQAAPCRDPCNRFRSKLSRFAKPEVPESESIAEITNADKSKAVNEIPVVEGSRKTLPKKLSYDVTHREEEIALEPNKHEIPKSNLNQKFDEVKDIECLQNECKNDSSFLFKDLNTTNLKENNGKQIPEEKDEEDVMFIGCSNISHSGDLPQSSQKSRRENIIPGKMNTTNTVRGGRSEQAFQDAKVKSTKEGNKSLEASVSTSPDLMEDCSLFEHMAEFGVEPATAKSPAPEDLNNSSYGLSITQVLNFMNDKSDCSTQQASTSNVFPKPSPIQSQKVQRNNRQSVSHLSSKSKLSLRRNSHHETGAKSDRCEFPGTSTSTQARDGPRLPFSRTRPNLPGKSNDATEQKKQQQHVKEKHVSFCTEENDEFEEMSESLLADVELKLMEVHRGVNGVTCGSEGSSKNSSTILYPMSDRSEEQADRTHEGSKDLFTTRLFSNGPQKDARESSKFMSPTQAEIRENSKLMSPTQADIRECSRLMSPTEANIRESSKLMSPTQANLRESSKLMSPTQDETQLLITRKRKAYHVLGSDQEDSILTSDSEKDVSKASTTSGSSRTSTVSTCVTAPVRRAVAEQMRSQFDDEDDDFVQGPGHPPSKQQKVNSILKKRKKKRRRLEYLDDEAEISVDAVGVSSDESSEDEKDYDRSFVDDGTYLTQDNAQDMRAIYLRSVVSPMKGKAHLDLPQIKYDYLDDSNASEGEEGEDSFVVDNSFVEYDTEYIGETMLAEDPIINQALQDQGNSKKTKDAATGNKAKRKRIILNESTSEEDTENERSPVKAPVGRTQPLHQVSGLSGRSQVRNTAVAGNQNTPSCSRDSLNDKVDLEIIMESKPFRPPPGPSKQSDKVLPVTSRSEQGFMSSSRPQSTSSRVSKSNYVQQATNKGGSAVSGQQAAHGVGRSVGHQERASGGGGSGSGTSKDTTGKVISERPEVSIISSLLASPTSPMGGCHSLLPVSPQLNVSAGSFFVSAEPYNSSFSSSQSSGSSTPQEAVGVLVDSSEVNSGGNVLSRLRLRYKAHTAVVHLTHAHYAVSTRMAVARLPATMLSSSQHRSRLVERVQGMLELYERPVLIVEDEADRGSPARQARSRYQDTIVCACIQVTALTVLYSKDQEETSHLLWQLLLQEKTRGFKISVVPTMTKKRQQMAKFYLTLPNIGYPTALTLAQRFSTVREFINSSAECIQEKGRMSLERAMAVKQQLTRRFREDMLP